MSRNPWPKSARSTSPVDPAPRCQGCAAKDEAINRLVVENHRLVRELVDTAASLAVAEGAPER